MKRQIECRVGAERLNKFGTLMRVVEYNNKNDITIEFPNKIYEVLINYVVEEE